MTTANTTPEAFAPTHTVTLDDQSIPVMLVDGAAYTEQEWETETSADYEHSDEDGWTFQGAAFNGGVAPVTTTFTCWDAESGCEVNYDAVDAEEAAKAYVADSDFPDDENKTHWIEIYAVEASELGKVMCTDDRYDPDGSIPYASVSAFLAMCRESFGESGAPTLTEDSDGDWVDEDGEVILISTGARDQAEAITIAIEPEEPKCDGDHEHNWVGDDNVYGHGGGVTYSEKCEHCGATKITDTWAQNPVNGQQGLTSVEYKPAGWELLDDY